jgi:hypothetical protein
MPFGKAIRRHFDGLPPEPWTYTDQKTGQVFYDESFAPLRGHEDHYSVQGVELKPGEVICIACGSICDSPRPWNYGMSHSKQSRVLTSREVEECPGPPKSPPPPAPLPRLKSGVKPSRNPPISASTISLSLYDPETGFQAGDRVQHHVFGEGVILGFSGSGDHTTVEVDFREIGQKTLLVRYANLKKL